MITRIANQELYNYRTNKPKTIKLYNDRTQNYVTEYMKL